MKAAPAQAIMLIFLFLILGIYLLQPKQTQVAESGSLQGLHSLNIQDIGPWVVNPSGVLTKPDSEVLALNNELCALTQNRLSGEAVTFDASKSAPKLKLLLNYGNDQSKLALRGTRQLNSLKLVLEDDVDLHRQPAKVVPIVTWSASIDTTDGSGTEKEIRAQYMQLLDIFLNDLRNAHGVAGGKSNSAGGEGAQTVTASPTTHAMVLQVLPTELIKASL